MSRCFPFPPPGYEKKPTLDEPDLLKKEKRKEKKHKKDKKDKEKRDGKEKREKDRSEGKHKEKKDKKDKDKHRDKKEKKSKSSSNTDEKRIHGQFEGYNGEKVHPNDSTRSSSSSDKKQSLQFQNGEYHDPLQRKEESNKDKNSSLDDKKSSIQFSGQNGEMVRNRIKATDTSENIKFVQELDRRIKNEEKGTGSHQFVVEGRKNSFNKIEIQKMDGGRQSIMEEAGFGSRNPTVQNKINGKTLPPLDNKIEKRIEQKEKMAEKESDDKRGDKRKHKDRDKQRQGKDKDTEKEKKEEKSKEKSEQKRAEREKNKYIRKSESVANPNSFSANPPENNFHGIGSEGNLKKRKDMETNGVSHENESRPNKMGRFSSSNIAPPENGRKLDSVQNSGSSLLDRQGASTNSFKMGSKGQRVNGMIDPQPVSVASKTPPFPAFNHIPAKPSPIKSPPVITNHIAARSPPPVPTTKPQPAAQPPPPVPTTKPQPAAQPPPPVPTTKPQPPVQLPTPKPPPSIPNHIAARSPPLLSTPPPPPSTTTAKQPPLSRPKPPPAVVNKAAPPPSVPHPKKKHEPQVKPPHPDTKYLNQILSVPKLDEWCGFDDQEWLFNRKEEHPCSKKTTKMEENQVQVWSEAKHIESVDICALPYVIPY